MSKSHEFRVTAAADFRNIGFFFLGNIGFFFLVFYSQSV